ncbi:hypothetical protein HDU93_004922 [Gonapodya sp. JEL0774]|nr:hypothetical protein HDU93_004922 [Gonapodya sp. JEL0774]
MTRGFWPYPHAQHRDPAHDAMVQVERVSGKEMTAERMHEFEQRCVPLVIGNDLVEHWPAFGSTTVSASHICPSVPALDPSTSPNSHAENPPQPHDWSLPTLASLYPSTVFKTVHHCPPSPRYHRRRPLHHKVSVRFADYIDYMHRQHDESPLYIFEPEFLERARGMCRGYDVPAIFPEDLFECLSPPSIPIPSTTPSTTFTTASTTHTGLTSPPPTAPTTSRPPFRWLVLGPPRSGASWHTDPYHTSAWNTLISGRKLWLLYPPHVPYPPCVFVDPTKPAGANAVAPWIAQWCVEVLPRLPPGARPIVFEQGPGETVVVPGGWWHAVLNIEASVAVTQNWTGRENLEKVLGEVGRMGDEKVSRRGCRDVSRWDRRVRDVVARCTGLSAAEGCGDGEVRPLGGGTNPVFVYLGRRDEGADFVVKFFSHISGGTTAWANEIVAYARIDALPATHGARMIVPDLVGFGLLNAGEVGKRERWCWPYVVTKYLGGDSVSLYEAQERAAASRSDASKGVGDGSVVTYTVDPAATARWIGTSLRALHHLPVLSASSIASWVGSHADRETLGALDVGKLVLECARTNFQKFLDEKWTGARGRLDKWKAAPQGIVDGVDGYLHVVRAQNGGPGHRGGGYGEAHRNGGALEDGEDSGTDVASDHKCGTAVTTDDKLVEARLDWESLLRLDSWDGRGYGQGGAGVGMLHGDLNPNNVMGRWKVVNDTNSRDGCQLTEKAFEPVAMIDLGDGHHLIDFDGVDAFPQDPSRPLDPAFDFVPVFLGLGVGRKRNVTRAFVDSYFDCDGTGPAQHDTPTPIPPRTVSSARPPFSLPLSSRMTRYWAGWEFEGVVRWGVRKFLAVVDGRKVRGRAAMARAFEKDGWSGVEKGLWGDVDVMT